MSLRYRILIGSGIVLLILCIAVYLGLQVRIEGGPPQLSGEVLERHLTVGGLDRDYLVYKPRRTVEHPAVIFVLHGSAGTPQLVRKITGRQFDRLADEQGIVIVYPHGYKNYWNDCRGSADYAANLENIDDVSFFEAMASKLESEFAIDTRRMTVTGASNGGQMVYRLALEKPEFARALVPLVANLPVADNLDCDSSGKAVNIAIVNGSSDKVNPWGGGVVTVLGNTSRGEVPSAMDSAGYFARLAGYEAGPTVTDLPDINPNDGGRPRQYQWTGQEQQVRLYELIGMGHNAPSRVVRYGWLLDWLSGGNNWDLEWADETWGFYQDVVGSP